MRTTQAIVDLVDAAISQILDPPPIQFREADESGVKPVRAACDGAYGTQHRLETEINRNAFLCGCLDFTDDEPIEHLIVGLGVRRGSTTKINGVIHLIGGKHSVSISPAVRESITRFVAQSHRAEVIVFHNHPPNPINVALDNLPVASRTDRDTLLRTLLTPIIATKMLMNGGSIRFYIGENGFVRQTRGPSVATLAQMMVSTTAT